MGPEEAGLLPASCDVLLEYSKSIIDRLEARLSSLVGGVRMFGNIRPGRSTRGIRHWLEIALRSTSRFPHKPKLSHLGLLASRNGLPLGHIIAGFCCLQEVCSETLRNAAEAGKIDSADLDISTRAVTKVLMSEEMAVASAYTSHCRLRHLRHLTDMQLRAQARSKCLANTVALSRSIAQEIDELQVVRALADNIMKAFKPECLMIHTLGQAGLVETPITIIGERAVRLPDDERIRSLRNDWRLCRAARTDNTFYVPDISESLIKCPAQVRSQTCGCYCCIPLASGVQVFGCIHLRRLKANAFSDEDLEVLNIYGQMVGSALTSLKLLKANRQQASTDPLTGLNNRRYFDDVIEKEDRLLHRRGGKVSLLMIDIDRFKRINDHFGHESGDKLLQAVGKCLQDAIRQTDELARYGGDEFVVLLRDCGPANALMVAEKIVERVSQLEMRLGPDRHWKPSVCIGASSSPKHAATLDEAMRQADATLLAAKRAGRNLAMVYDATWKFSQATIASKG